VALALERDPWLSGSRERERALGEEAVAASALPDPTLSLLAGNLPVDSLAIDREPMTQLAVGISQRFPRGDSRQLAGQRKREEASRESRLRELRRAQLRLQVTELWLDLYLAGESIRLVEEDRSLFTQLAEVTRSIYSTASGTLRQQDLIRAQLELARLEDRLLGLRQQRDRAREQLAEWIGAAAWRPLSSQAPAREGLPTALRGPGNGDAQQVYELLMEHPLLRAQQQRIAAMDTGTELARQRLRPEWSLSAQYGYRDDDLLGNDRADLFSVGISVDLPLFTTNRQQREINAAAARAEAERSEHALIARRLVARMQATLASLQRIEERRNVYHETLLPQMSQQAEAALSAYDSDDGDFAEAVRARIAVLDARLDALELDLDRQRELATIDYLLAGSDLSTGAVP